MHKIRPLDLVDTPPMPQLPDRRHSVAPLFYQPVCFACAVTLLGFASSAPGRETDPSVAALGCLGCHMTQDSGDQSTVISPLDRLDATDIMSALHDYRDGKRLGTVMNRIAKGLSDQEIEGIARFLGYTR